MVKLCEYFLSCNPLILLTVMIIPIDYANYTKKLLIMNQIHMIQLTSMPAEWPGDSLFCAFALPLIYRSMLDRIKE